MKATRLLVANRGEVAVRIIKAAGELGMQAVAVFSQDDADALHTRMADHALPLSGAGVQAYLDAEQILAIAHRAGASLIHPGYGLLSENPVFAQRTSDEGMTFVGPNSAVLREFGNKSAARALASRLGIPVLAATQSATTLEQARSFFASLAEGQTCMVKAVSGGGGRGIRPVDSLDELAEAFKRCQSEAESAFGDGGVYLEHRLNRARHIEVQVVGDRDCCASLSDRDCSIQRHRQKLIEIAPAPGLSESLRARLADAAVLMADTVGLSSLCTFEFLVDLNPGTDADFFFLEANPRLQVEHTVTEEVLGLDLVAAQLQLAQGATLSDLGLLNAGDPRGHAIQARVNLETMRADGTAQAAGGRLTAFEPPTGHGIRVDTGGHAGYSANPNFDSLLAKVIAHSLTPDIATAARKAHAALGEFRIEGAQTNISLLESILSHPSLAKGDISTRFVDEHAAELAGRPHSALGLQAPGEQTDTQANSQTDQTVSVTAPTDGRVVEVCEAIGAHVRAHTALVVVEAMKMEHVVTTPQQATVEAICVSVGDSVRAGQLLASLQTHSAQTATDTDTAAADPSHIRADLEEVLKRHSTTRDEARPDAIKKRHSRGGRSARENIEDLVDAGTFTEYGALAIAAQRRRRDEAELREKTPADGLVAGIASVNGELFSERNRCAVMSYDYTVLAGTQGLTGHRKKDRLFELVERLRLPVVFFAEGGGGRPGDTDYAVASSLDTRAFALWARLSGLVFRVAVVSGRCFAGNAAIAGCSDLVIATENATIGMGGPAMIEAAGLGTFEPEQIGPTRTQAQNGTVDVCVADETEAVSTAKKVVSYFQGSVERWDCADQAVMRTHVPENRLRTYDTKNVIYTLADSESVTELRREFAPGMITALIRIEGRALGIIANNPTHLAGAITSEGSDKAARFLQLCDTHDLPIVSLIDTPGIMVGPDAEAEALVRHCSRLFVASASITVPFVAVVLRKGYGLGAQAMAAGSFHEPLLTVAWPTAELGPMGLEGAVQLGYRRELDAISDPDQRQAKFEEMVNAAYTHSKGLNAATYFEIDDVIDPADSRQVIANVIGSAQEAAPTREKRGFVDTW